MSASSAREPFEAPDNRPALLDRALGHFLASRATNYRPVGMLYTDGRRPTPNWRGLTDQEVLILGERGYVELGLEQTDGRRPVVLTADGLAARNRLAGRGKP